MSEKISYESTTMEDWLCVYPRKWKYGVDKNAVVLPYSMWLRLLTEDIPPAIKKHIREQL